jgi:hypothetical protein
MVGEELSALALVEVIVGEGFLGDLFCIPTGGAHGEFGLRRSPGRMDEREGLVDPREQSRPPGGATEPPEVGSVRGSVWVPEIPMPGVNGQGKIPH